MNTLHNSSTTQPGDIDTTFGVNGTVHLNTYRTARTVAQDPQTGKIIGTISSTGGFTLFRLNQDGSLDQSFGLEGRVVTRFADYGNEHRPTAVRLLADGRIFVAGEVHGQALLHTRPAAALFNSDGSDVIEFGQQGRVVMDITPESTAPQAATDAPLSSDFVFSFKGGAFTGYGTVICLTAQGALDQRFAGRGFLTFKLYDRHDTVFNQLRVRRDGTLMLAGYTAHEPLVVALTAYGELEPSFNGGVRSFSEAGLRFTCLALYDDDRVLCVGHRGGIGYVLRLHADGLDDVSFNRGQPLSIDLGQERLRLTQAEVLADQRILLGGDSEERHTNIFRRQPDGSPDAAFGTAGRIRATDAFIYGMALQTDGNILIAGNQANLGTVQRYLGA
jgi:uncharacterized delta-60 repeat protein